MLDFFPDLPTLILFLSACLVLQLSPGPDMLIVINNSVARGRRAGIMTVFGIFSGIALQAPLLVLGTISLVSSYEHALSMIQVVGITYLAYLSYKNLRKFFAGQNDAVAHVPAPQSSAILDGFVTNVTNPKVVFFLLSFLPQFVDQDKGNIAVQILILLSILKCNGFLVNGTIALTSSWLGQAVSGLKGKRNFGALLSGLVFAAISIYFLTQMISDHFGSS